MQALPDAPNQTLSLSTPAEIDTAKKLITARDFHAAEPVLRSYLERNDSSLEARTLLAYTLLRLDQPKESLGEYARAAKLKTPSAEDLRNVADDYALLKDYNDADYWLIRSLEKNPQDPETWYKLGRIRYSLQHFEDAARFFQKTLTLSPRSVKAADNLGLSYEALNRTDEAIDQYRLALSWQEGSAHPSEQPMLNLAIVLIHRGHGDQALPLLKQASNLKPADAKIHEQLGQLYLQQEALDDAQHEFEKAIALSPTSGAYHFLLGQVYRRQHLTAKAQAEFQQSATLNGSHSTPE